MVQSQYTQYTPSQIILIDYKSHNTHCSHVTAHIIHMLTSVFLITHNNCLTCEWIFYIFSRIFHFIYFSNTTPIKWHREFSHSLSDLLCFSLCLLLHCWPCWQWGLVHVIALPLFFSPKLSLTCGFCWWHHFFSLNNTNSNNKKEALGVLFTSQLFCFLLLCF